ncbi:hypothetical protein F2A31_07625 [Acinetobacter suaedae]|uniref:Uncharacterized protein n=1 Tax=Acinetobacter suaedae TaxID=2609668 RepID=A0A5P1UTB3_9GAMM|nr:hypothetical protein [Acinetobacter sp. C16S1]QER39588.1 hypothetical protein F2A31_07625 [Acinetobacter sp. C16S1]
MDNWKYALIASIVTILGMSIASMLTAFRLWKVTLTIFCISSIGFCVIGVLGRRSENNGFDGAWGVHGVWREFLNLETVLVSLGVGTFITLLFFLAIVSSKNK